MTRELGNISVDATVQFTFWTYGADGAPIAPSSALENSDVRIYKDGSATQRSSAAGITMTSPFDSLTGCHHLAIDLSDDTDSGFYADGSTYEVVLSPDETVAGLAVGATLARFTIGASNADIAAAIGTPTDIEGSGATLSGNAVDVYNQFSAIAAVLRMNQGAVGATGNDTTHVHIEGYAGANDDPVGQYLYLVTDAGSRLVRRITDYVVATELATIDPALPNAPVPADDLWYVLTARADDRIAALPTAADNADAVWEEDLSDHSGTAGSTAEQLAAAGAAGDPWATALPGAYTSGQAGKIVGDNLNATLSSRASQASLDTVDGVADGIAAAIGTPIDRGNGATLAGNLDVVHFTGQGIDAGVSFLSSAVILRSGTVGATGNDTTHVHLEDLGMEDDEIVGLQLVLVTDAFWNFTAWITDYVAATELATIEPALPNAPVGGDDSWYVLSRRRDSGLTAAETRSALGLATNNLDTQLGDIPTNSELATALAGADDAVLAAIGGLNNLSSAGAQAAAAAALAAYGAALEATAQSILTDTAEIGAAGAGLTEAGGTGDHLSGVPWNASWDAEVQSEAADALVAYDPPTKAELDSAVAPLALEATAQAILTDTGTDIPASLSTIAGYLDTEIAAILAAVDTEIAAILADTNELQGDWTNGGRLDLLIDAIKAKTDNLPAAPAATGDIPSTSAIATAVWASATRTLTALGFTLGASDLAADTLTAAKVAADVGTEIAAAVLTTAMTESYNADGSPPTLAQAMFVTMQRLTEFAIAGTTITVKKLDGSTAAYTLTLDDDTSPTSSTRAT